jgi:S1-C subfamily serine protease
VSGLVLRVVRGAGEGREIVLGDQFVIGREAAGEGRLDGEPALSRRHARIIRGAAGGLTIEDLGSLNGTRVNGERIATATALAHGDRIQLGETVLVVADPGDPAERTPAVRAHDTVLADAPPALRAPGPVAGRGRPGAGVAALAERPEVRLGAVAALALVGIVVWLLIRGGDADPQTILRDGRRSTVQLIVQPTGVVQRLAALVPATAPPRSGSGIVVDARRGLILTADRLVAGAARISGRFGNGPARRATLVARAPCDGIALVRLPGLPGGARAADLGAAGGLRRGDRVVALGYRGSRVGDGRVRGGGLRSAAGAIAGGRGRATLDPADPRLSGLVLHTARLGAGGAGGPLVDGDGRVVALNLVAPDRARIGGALPIERAQGLYGDLATARTERDLGLRLEPWSEIRRGRPGLLVTGVDPGGSALLGATIFSIGGVRVDDAGDVCRALAGVRRGERVRARADVRSGLPAGRGLRRASRARAVAVGVRL